MFACWDADTLLPSLKRPTLSIRRRLAIKTHVFAGFLGDDTLPECEDLISVRQRMPAALSDGGNLTRGLRHRQIFGKPSLREAITVNYDPDFTQRRRDAAGI